MQKIKKYIKKINVYVEVLKLLKLKDRLIKI